MDKYRIIIKYDPSEVIKKIGALLASAKSWWLAAFCMILLGSCSSEFDDEWKKPDYLPVHFQKVVVVGLSHDINQRMFYEREAVARLDASGFGSIEGITLFPQRITELDNNQDSISSIIEKNEVDAVLAIKILHENDWDFMMPEDYGKFKKLYFRRRSFYTFNANYYDRPEKYYMVATLYDLHEKHEENEETVIWRASSQIANPSGNKKEMQDFINHAVAHIVEQHYLD